MSAVIPEAGAPIAHFVSQAPFDPASVEKLSAAQERVYLASQLKLGGIAGRADGGFVVVGSFAGTIAATTHSTQFPFVAWLGADLSLQSITSFAQAGPADPIAAHSVKLLPGGDFLITGEFNASQYFFPGSLTPAGEGVSTVNHGFAIRRNRVGEDHFRPRRHRRVAMLLQRLTRRGIDFISSNPPAFDEIQQHQRRLRVLH